MVRSAFLLVVATAACGSADRGEPAQAARMPDEAGFVEIEPVDWAIHHQGTRTALTSGRARLFYAFQPADESPESKPLAVVFNGGPGAASGVLFGLSTARSTLDPTFAGGASVAPNPASWTRFANLLYVDARGTGFSYGIVPGADDEQIRAAEFHPKSFNPFVDGADLVRVVLRFLRAHPALRASPVVLVAESYGGVRASVALHQLLFHDAYAAGGAGYEDPALVAEVREHLGAVFGDGDHGPERVSEQFGAQLLLQARLSSMYQDAAAGPLLEAEDGPVAALSAETGVTFVRCADKPAPCDPYDNALDYVVAVERDYYDLRKPAGWTVDRYADIAPSFVDAAVLEAALGVAPASIPGLAAVERGDAFRVIAAEPGAEPISATLGELAAWDRYHRIELFDIIGAPFAGPEAAALGLDRRDPRYGELFLANLRHVRTFSTDAPHDVIIYGGALAGALALYQETVAGVTTEPGRMVVRFADGEERALDVRRYGGSGHSITLYQPSELADDVAAWLGETQ